MLVLSRKPNETVVIDGSIRITVVGIRGNQIRLGIEAPDRVRVLRGELTSPGRRAGRDLAGVRCQVRAEGPLGKAVYPVPTPPAEIPNLV